MYHCWPSCCPVPCRAIAYRYQIVSLSKQQVQHIAQLARLQLEDDQFDDIVAKLSAIVDLTASSTIPRTFHDIVAKLSSIVDFVDQLQQAPTDDVVPMAHPLNQVQRLRPDVVTEADEREAIQGNAPVISDGFYIVPKVIE